MSTTVEALVRWMHPVHGLIMPGRFMPLAEQSDRDGAAHHPHRQLAIDQCAAWRQNGRDLRISINASARNLHDLHFPAMLADMLHAAAWTRRGSSWRSPRTRS